MPALQDFIPRRSHRVWLIHVSLWVEFCWVWGDESIDSRSCQFIAQTKNHERTFLEECRYASSCDECRC